MNLIWMFSDKVLRLILGVYIGVLITRHLGPYQFGVWNYVIAIVALINSLVNVGVDSIFLNELTSSDKNQVKKLFSSAIILRLLSGSIGYILLLSFMFNFIINNNNIFILYFIIGSNLIWQSSEIFDIFFQFEQRIKQVTISKYLSFGIATLLKVTGIYLNLNLTYFVIVSSIEIIVYSIVISIVFYRYFGKLNLILDFSVVKGLLKKGFPLMLSSFLIILYMRIDQIMLGYLKGDFEVGIYTSALKLSEIWYLIPTIIIGSFSTEILSLKKEKQLEFERRLKGLLSFLIYISIVFSLLVTVFSNDMVLLIYGKEFVKSAPVLTIHIWTGVFVSVGICSNLYSISSNLNYLVLYKSLIGAVTNIILNLIFIPLFNALGAALATLISYFVVTFVSDLFWKSSYGLWKLKSQSLLLPLHLIRLK